jgi:hypothetical protein
LQSFLVSGNRLTGPIPAAPRALVNGGSQLCAPAHPVTGDTNFLTLSPDGATNAAWNAATGMADWSVGCRQVPPPVNTPVPTLDAKGLLALALFTLLFGGMAVAGTGFVQRRQ